MSYILILLLRSISRVQGGHCSHNVDQDLFFYDIFNHVITGFPQSEHEHGLRETSNPQLKLYNCRTPSCSPRRIFLEHELHSLMLVFGARKGMRSAEKSALVLRMLPKPSCSKSVSRCKREVSTTKSRSPLSSEGVDSYTTLIASGNSSMLQPVVIAVLNLSLEYSFSVGMSYLSAIW